MPLHFNNKLKEYTIWETTHLLSTKNNLYLHFLDGKMYQNLYLHLPESVRRQTEERELLPNKHHRARQCFIQLD